MSLAVPLPYFLKLDRRFVNRALIMRQPDTPAVLTSGDTSFREP